MQHLIFKRRKKCVIVQIVKDLTVCGAEHEAYFPYVHNAYINYPKSDLLVLSTPICLFLRSHRSQWYQYHHRLGCWGYSAGGDNPGGNWLGI